MTRLEIWRPFLATLSYPSAAKATTVDSDRRRLPLRVGCGYLLNAKQWVDLFDEDTSIEKSSVKTPLNRLDCASAGNVIFYFFANLLITKTTRLNIRANE
jgi:hypothetical protein